MAVSSQGGFSLQHAAPADGLTEHTLYNESALACNNPAYTAVGAILTLLITLVQLLLRDENDEAYF